MGTVIDWVDVFYTIWHARYILIAVAAVSIVSSMFEPCAYFQPHGGTP